MDTLSRAKNFQAHNRKLKQHVARTDAENAYQAMHGGLTGIGCNDAKLIAALCGRTKTQLRYTAKQFREKQVFFPMHNCTKRVTTHTSPRAARRYDKDLRKDVKGEAGGSYGKMMQVCENARATSAPPAKAMPAGTPIVLGNAQETSPANAKTADAPTTRRNAQVVRPRPARGIRRGRDRRGVCRRRLQRNCTAGAARVPVQGPYGGGARLLGGAPRLVAA